MRERWNRRCSAPRRGYYSDLVEEAAALWESLAQTHPFVDGAKRAAFAATYTFLAINGLGLRASAEEIYAFVSGLYERQAFVFAELASWLREHVVPE